jgi:hypothetical protein
MPPANETAMFEFLTVFFLLVFGLTVLSGIGAFAMTAIYGENPPPAVRHLADVFTEVYVSGAAGLFGIFRNWRPPQVREISAPHTKTLPPPSDNAQSRSKR